MWKTLTTCVAAICFGIFLCAQAPLSSFPPGAFSNKAALDPAAGSTPPTWTQTDSAVNGTCANPCTLTVNATTGFNVVIVGGFLSGSATAVVGSASLNGSSLSPITRSGNYANGYDIEVWAGSVTGGSVTFSAATSPAGFWSSMYVGVGVLANLSSTTSTSQCNGTDAGVTAAVSCSTTITVPSSGFAICGGLESFTSTLTSSNLTIDAQSSTVITGAIAHALAASGTFTPAISDGNTFTQKGIACGAWH